MKTFLKKTFWVVLPMLSIQLFTFFFYLPNKGDLLRLGYIADLHPKYREIFKEEFNNQKHYTQISGKVKKSKYTVLTLGDSFSELGVVGYQNYLAESSDINVLHIDRQLSKNQIQTLFGLINGDFFDKYHVEYVILQSVERHFIDIIENIDTANVLCIDQLVDAYNVKTENFQYDFFSRTPFLVTFNTFKYLFSNTSLFNEQVYRIPIAENLFSVKRNELLIYYYDILNVSKNNDINNLKKLNAILNSLHHLLAMKGIKLIILPSPDKYSVYYDYISDTKNFPEPLFFQKVFFIK